MLDLSGLRQLIHGENNGVIPESPLKDGVNLSNAPHVHLALLRKLKEEHGV